MRFVEHRVADERVLRLIQKWLNAGVIEDGARTFSEQGTPQAATISPLLANVYLHDVFDLWVKQWRSRHARGDVILVRYADDFVVGFGHRDDAERFLAALRVRFARYALELHPEKTRLIEFGRFAARDRQRRGDGKPETFDFLGFAHICAKSKSGRFKLKRITIKKRRTAKLGGVKTELNRRRHEPIPDQGRWLASVVAGHVNYYGVPDNSRAIQTFRWQVVWHWHRALRRRSQRTRLTWERMDRLAERWLPPARVAHPWPQARFAASTQVRSPVR
jgi:RNA-directed DNA polymerase